jgi:hypothetical protein
MRTTVNLPNELLAQVKKAALEAQTTVTALIEEALRETLARRRRKPQGKPVDLPTFGSGGLQPGVDLDDSAALLDLTEPSGVPVRR